MRKFFISILVGLLMWWLVMGLVWVLVNFFDIKALGFLRTELMASAVSVAVASFTIGWLNSNISISAALVLNLLLFLLTPLVQRLIMGPAVYLCWAVDTTRFQEGLAYIKYYYLELYNPITILLGVGLILFFRTRRGLYVMS